MQRVSGTVQNGRLLRGMNEHGVAKYFSNTPCPNSFQQQADILKSFF